MAKTIRNRTERKAFKRSTIAACVMAVSAVHAQAQDTTDNPEILEEVVVYGIKQSLQNAQDIKRDAATVKDVITASDISALPDKSIVEAVSRIPGVSIERFAASDDPDHFSVEGSGVIVRGLNRTRSEINGRDSFSASRSSGLNFSDIPAELMKGVEVVKNTTADLVEGGISGSINLITRKPFDSDEMVLGGSVKALHSNKIDENTPEASIVFSNVWDIGGGEIGFLVNGSRQVIKSRSEGVQAFNYYERSRRAYGDPEPATLEPFSHPWAVGEPVYDQNGHRRFETQRITRVLDDGTEVLEEAIGEPIRGLNEGLETGASDNKRRFLPIAGQFRRQDNNRERESFAASLQFRNTDETILVTAEHIRSESSLAWNERFVEHAEEAFQPGRANSFTLINEPGISGKEESFNDNGLFTQGIIYQPNHVNGTRLREESSLIEDSSLKLEFTPNDNLKISADFQHISSESDVLDNVAHTINKNQNGEAYHYFDVSGDIPRIQLLGGGYAVEEGEIVSTNPERYSLPENVTFRSMMDHIAEANGESNAASIDAEYTFDNGFITSVKAGLRSSKKEQEIFESDFNWGNVSQEWNETASSCQEFSELCEFYDFGSDFHNGDVFVGDTPTGFWFPRLDLIRDFESLDEYIKLDGDPNTDGIQAIHALNESAGRINLRDRPGVITRTEGDKTYNTPYLPTEVYEVTEERQAAYVRVDFASDDTPVPIKGNFGLRYVSYDLSSTGGSNFSNFGGEFLAGENYTGGNVLIPQSALDFASKNSSEVNTVDADTFTTVLPSLNVNFEVTDDLIIRFAASRGIFLPDLADVRNNFSVSARAEGTPADALNNGGTYDGVNVSFVANDVGNPLLKPEESTNLDLTAEWYFSDVGSLTFALFNKEVEDIFRKEANKQTVLNKAAGVSQIVDTTSTVNSGDASITGFEIAYQQTYDSLPEPFNGLGTQINYTYIDGEQTTQNSSVDAEDKGSFRAFDDLPLEGLSEDTFNFVIFYENERFDTRFAYNWRSEFLLNSRDVIAFSPIYQNAYGQLDWSFNYKINDNIAVGLQATNLLDSVTETEIQLNQEGVTTPRSFFVNDRQYALTLKANL